MGPWYQNPGWWALIVTITISLVGVLSRSSTRVWLKKQWLKHYPPSSFNVAISIKSGGNDSLALSEQLKDEIEKILIANGLVNEVHILDFRQVLNFEDIESAEKYRQKHGINLLIWGNFTPDGLKYTGREYSGLRLAFTYGYPAINPALGMSLSKEFSTVLATRQYWNIFDRSLEDLVIVGSNIFDISAYILGVTLKLSGRLSDSRSIFEGIYKKNRAQIDGLLEGVRAHLTEIYQIAIQDYLIGREVEKGLDVAKRLAEMYPNEIPGIVPLAVFSFLNGDVRAAEELVNKLLGLFPYKPVTWVDLAFIRILQRKYEAALKQYKKLIEVPTEKLDFEPYEPIDFLDEQFDKTGEAATKFGSAILNIYHGDELRGQQLLREFIEIADPTIYEPMVRFAKGLVR